MGCAASSTATIITSDGGTEADYKERFDELKKLGEGEFGVVKLICEKNKPEAEKAVKILNKGFTFKDNVLYAPMKPENLRMEIDILRTLNGEKFNLFLDAVYESSSKIFVVTEICSGGEMLEFTSETMSEGLRTEDVSRIAFQLISAVAHCDKHNVFHRDIKPENIMFKSKSKSSELRLIDFGCATMDGTSDVQHATFAGTPFYISPEMFQKKYTTKTDVFSVGVTLYVLVGGYPAAELQAAFNILQKSKRDLKTLPGMPDNMPESYYNMLDKLLKYQYKGRASAGEMLDDDFVLFHQAHEGKITRKPSLARTASVLLSGTGEKAAKSFGFSKFERSVTTILVTHLKKEDLQILISKVENQTKAAESNALDLGVVKMNDIKQVLKEMGKDECITAIANQKKAATYDDYAYDYTVLKQFTKERNSNDTNTLSTDGNGRNGMTKMMSKISTRDLSTSSTRNINTSDKRKAMAKAQSVFVRGL